MLSEYIFTFMGPPYVYGAPCKYLLFDGVAGLHMGNLVLSQWLQAPLTLKIVTQISLKI